jgi:GlcNAc-P-P-Und epimerase
MVILRGNGENVMPVCVTGGAGFLGSEICKKLSNERILHTIYDRKYPRFKSKYTNYVQGDIRDLERLISATKQHQVVIHLAAEWNDVGVTDHEYNTTNIDGTKNIADAAESNNIKSIIFASSTSVYKFEDDNYNAYRENDVAEDPPGIYGKTKAAGEDILRSWQSKSKSKNLKIIRPSVIYGPYNRGNVFNLIKQIKSRFFILPRKYDVVKSIAYVGNVANFFIYLLMKETSDTVYNYCDNPSLNTYELVQKINQLLSRKATLINIDPNILIKISSFLDCFPGKIKNKFGSMKVRKFLRPTYLSNELAFKTGFNQPVNTEDGLKETVEWIIQNGNG